MKNSNAFVVVLVMLHGFTSCAQKPVKDNSETVITSDSTKLSEEEWKEKLSAFEYHVLREKGTERAFSGEFWDHKEKGIYTCGGCGLELFSSDTKYKSGSGWPSYWDAVNKENVKVEKDFSYGWNRDEVLCGRCGGHLGHVFNDGPRPTGLRYCINSASLDFKKK